MKKTNKIILTVAIVAVLLLGIGYAAIQNITLNISGSAAADPSQSNFKVMFSGTPTVSDDTYVTAAITDDTNATINVEGLTKKGDVVTATYTVQNASTDLSADLGVSTTNDNTEFFTLSSELATTSLVAGEATTLTVTVELTKTPIIDSVSATIGVQLEAMPVQPGEEGTSEGINDFSQTPDNKNEYGFYFGVPYRTDSICQEISYDNGAIYMVGEVIFNENNTCTIRMISYNDSYEELSSNEETLDCIYGNLTATIEGEALEFNNNGTKIMGNDGIILKLSTNDEVLEEAIKKIPFAEIAPPESINEYGFVFGDPTDNSIEDVGSVGRYIHKEECGCEGIIVYYPDGSTTEKQYNCFEHGSSSSSGGAVPGTFVYTNGKISFPEGTKELFEEQLDIILPEDFGTIYVLANGHVLKIISYNVSVEKEELESTRTVRYYKLDY